MGEKEKKETKFRQRNRKRASCKNKETQCKTERNVSNDFKDKTMEKKN